VTKKGRRKPAFLLGIRPAVRPIGTRNSRQITEFAEKTRQYFALCDLCYIPAALGPDLFIFPSG
jgi:hypothetical protein